MPKIPQSKIQEVVDRVDIVDLVSQYVKLKKKGKNYFALCPFHNEETPSFSVSPEKNIYHCFGCGAGGNVINFIMEYEKMNFVDAVKHLADQYGIEIDLKKNSSGKNSIIYNLHQQAEKYYKKCLKKSIGSQARDYLKSRDFSGEIAKKFSIGYAPDKWEGLHNFIDTTNISVEALEKSGLFIKRKKGNGVYDRFRNRIMFPIKNLSGKTIAFGGRALDPDDNAKYLNSPDTPIYNKRKILYGLNITNENIRKQEEAIVVEGYTDLIRLYSRGVKNVVAGSGTALTKGHARILKRYCDTVRLCYDGDMAGQKAAIRAGFIFLKQGMDVFVMELPEEDDPDSYIQKVSSEEFKNVMKSSPDFIKFYVNKNKDKLKTPAKISSFIDKTINELQEINNSVTRDLVVRRLSDEVNISEKRILNQLEYKKSKRGSRGNKSGKKENISLNLNRRTDKSEFELIKLLLSNNDKIVNFILSEINKDSFQHSVLKKLAVRLINKLKEEGEIDPRSLYNENIDKKEKAVMSKILFDLDGFLDGQNFEDLLTLAGDCIKTIRKREIKKDIKNIRKKIKQKEKEDSEPPKELLNKLVEKQKENRKINDYMNEKLESI